MADPCPGFFAQAIASFVTGAATGVLSSSAGGFGAPSTGGGSAFAAAGPGTPTYCLGISVPCQS